MQSMAIARRGARGIKERQRWSLECSEYVDEGEVESGDEKRVVKLVVHERTQPNALRFVPERLLALKEETEHLSSDTVFHDP